MHGSFGQVPSENHRRGVVAQRPFAYVFTQRAPGVAWRTLLADFIETAVNATMQ
jgi:hypothetical protein